MEDLEEVIVTPASRRHPLTESRAGQWLVIGAVALGLVPGLCAGGLFSAMIDEALTHVKDLLSTAEDIDWNIVPIQLSKLGFLIVIVSSLVGIALGYGAYSFLISIKGQQAKATALAGAAPAALLGTTACGAVVGALCNKHAMKFGLVIAVWLTLQDLIFFTYAVVLALCGNVKCKNNKLLVECLNISAFCFGLEFLRFFSYLGLAGVYLYFCLFFLFFHMCHVITMFYDYSEKPVLVQTVCPTLLLLLMLLFFVGTGTGTQSADEKGLVVGVLAPQLLEAAVGLSAFLHTGGGGGVGAGKVCAGAVAAGGAVLVAIQKASPMLNTGARLWGLIGVSGAAGVALSAAGALGQRYGEAATRVWGGKLGRTATVLGAAAGAFLSGGTSDVRLGLFKAVCAAVISGMPLVELIFVVFYHGLFSVYRRIKAKFQRDDELTGA